MIDLFGQLTINQFEATFCTLNACVERCPDALWHERVAAVRFCQVAFHTLFFADYYLGPDAEGFRLQPFHREHSAVFGDYEEFEPRLPVVLYEKAWIGKYLAHCRRKAKEALATETLAELEGPARFQRRNMSRAELHIYNIRHIQHHSAQLILRLRLDSTVDIPWFGSGWTEPAR